MTNSRNASEPSRATRRLRRLALTAAAVAGYLTVGAVLHQFVFAQSVPDSSSYPRAGDALISRAEGLQQVLLRVEQGQAYTRTVFEPGATGPPIHWHRDFDEEFFVTEGTLHIWHQGQVVEVGAGDSYRIPARSRHRPFNPTEYQAVVESSDHPSYPIEFAACLAQVYGYMDESGTGPSMLAQMAVFGPVCDTHVMPEAVEGLVANLVAPTARLLGMKNHYERFEAKRRSTQLDY